MTLRATSLIFLLVLLSPTLPSAAPAATSAPPSPKRDGCVMRAFGNLKVQAALFDSLGLSEEAFAQALKVPAFAKWVVKNNERGTRFLRISDDELIRSINERAHYEAGDLLRTASGKHYEVTNECFERGVFLDRAKNLATNQIEPLIGPVSLTKINDPFGYRRALARIAVEAKLDRDILAAIAQADYPGFTEDHRALAQLLEIKAKHQGLSTRTVCLPDRCLVFFQTSKQTSAEVWGGLGIEQISQKLGIDFVIDTTYTQSYGYDPNFRRIVLPAKHFLEARRIANVYERHEAMHAIADLDPQRSPRLPGSIQVLPEAVRNGAHVIGDQRKHLKEAPARLVALSERLLAVQAAGVSTAEQLRSRIVDEWKRYQQAYQVYSIDEVFTYSYETQDTWRRVAKGLQRLAARLQTDALPRKAALAELALIQQEILQGAARLELIRALAEDAGVQLLRMNRQLANKTGRVRVDAPIRDRFVVAETTNSGQPASVLILNKQRLEARAARTPKAAAFDMITADLKKIALQLGTIERDLAPRGERLLNTSNELFARIQQMPE